jgi:hypothetical protein
MEATAFMNEKHQQELSIDTIDGRKVGLGKYDGRDGSESGVVKE